MAKQEYTYEEIMRELVAGQYKPVYALMGEEAYYIDQIASFIEEKVLTEEEKDFNLTVLYGGDVSADVVVSAARRYPMMAERQVVIVREAQAMSGLESLSYYVQQPMMSTILVLCYKHGVMDRRKKLTALIEKNGVLFESKKLKDGQVPGFISTYLKKRKVDIEAKAAVMLADFVGTDLARLAGELDKLIITLPSGQNRVTPEHVERNIGISKDFNNFELRSALVEKDVLKVNRIIKYFSENPKANPIQVTLATLFGFYSNLMLAYYAPEKSEKGVAAWLGLKSPWQSREYLTAMKQYSGVKTMQIIGDIRYADACSKGVGKGNMSDYDILRELAFRIMH